MRRLAALSLTAVLAAGCVRATTSRGAIDVDVNAPGEGAVEEWRGTLQSQAGFNVRGSSVANSGRGQTAVSVSIAGAPAGGTHPWHIHSGKCGENGAIVGNPAAYPPLRADASGSATASARLGLVLNETDNYYINIHASPTQMGTIVACGAIDD